MRILGHYWQVFIELTDLFKTDLELRPFDWFRHVTGKYNYLQIQHTPRIFTTPFGCQFPAIQKLLKKPSCLNCSSILLFFRVLNVIIWQGQDIFENFWHKSLLNQQLQINTLNNFFVSYSTLFFRSRKILFHIFFFISDEWIGSEIII